MSNSIQLVRDQSICSRKERRYKTNGENLLRCETALESGGLRRGSILDLSATGMRMVCDGKFNVGEVFTVELNTDRSHGMYRGVVRRVDPWVDGKTILGCSLNDVIKEEVLSVLADEGVLDRRSDSRVEMIKEAKVSWQLQPGEVNAELRDCSNGGLRLIAWDPIPQGCRLRVRILHEDNNWIEVEGNSVWRRELDQGAFVGVAFTQKDAPSIVAPLLESCESKPEVPIKTPMMGPVSYAACAVILMYTILVTV
ncbi:MAG: PilZ domain-containing protein [Rubripirellula sp.]